MRRERHPPTSAAPITAGPQHPRTHKSSASSPTSPTRARRRFRGWWNCSQSRSAAKAACRRRLQRGHRMRVGVTGERDPRLGAVNPLTPGLCWATPLHTPAVQGLQPDSYLQPFRHYLVPLRVQFETSPRLGRKRESLIFSTKDPLVPASGVHGWAAGVALRSHVQGESAPTPHPGPGCLHVLERGLRAEAERVGSGGGRGGRGGSSALRTRVPAGSGHAAHHPAIAGTGSKDPAPRSEPASGGPHQSQELADAFRGGAGRKARPPPGPDQSEEVSGGVASEGVDTDGKRRRITSRLSH